MFEDDFILRSVKQIAVALSRALGLKQAGQEEQAQQTLEGAYDELLGPSREFLDSVDGNTLYRLVANVQIARALGCACAMEAQFREDAGETAKATLRAQQARDLLRAARAEDSHDEAHAQLAGLDEQLRRLGSLRGSSE